jgi:ribosomal protein S6
MAQSNYESLLLIKTEATNDEISNIEKNLEEVLSVLKGKLTVFDQWGKYLLAYPVNKNSYGVYVLIRYIISKENATVVNEKIDSFFKIKCNDIILRHVTVNISEKQASTYQKPEFIVDKPKSGFNSAQERRIEQLLDSVESTTKSSQTTANKREAPTIKEKKENIEQTTTQED